MISFNDIKNISLATKNKEMVIYRLATFTRIKTTKIILNKQFYLNVVPLVAIHTLPNS